MASTLTLLTDWSFLDKHVQQLSGYSDFISSESTVVCAGPATLTKVAAGGVSGNLVPIGLVQNVQVSQNKQIQQLFEIGSRKPFFIPGRTFIQVGMSRALFDGPSLLRAVYEYDDPNSSDADRTPNDHDGVTAGIGTDVGAPTDPYDVDAKTATGQFYINLASEFFNRPFGLGFVVKAVDDGKYGGFFLENCFIQSHSFSLAGQQTVVMENAGIRASELIPFEGAVKKS